jgi:hypothetical protein
MATPKKFGNPGKVSRGEDKIFGLEIAMVNVSLPGS